METAKSLKEGVGRREQVSQCWKPVSLKQKGFVVVEAANVYVETAASYSENLAKIMKVAT